MNDGTLSMIFLCLVGIVLISGLSFICGAELIASHHRQTQPQVTWEVLETIAIGMALSRTSVPEGWIYRYNESITFVPVGECTY